MCSFPSAQVCCNALIPAALAAAGAWLGGLSDWPLGAHSRPYTAAAGAFLGCEQSPHMLQHPCCHAFWD